MKQTLLAILAAAGTLTAFAQPAAPNAPVLRPYTGQEAPPPVNYETMTYNGGTVMVNTPVTAYAIFYGTAWSATQRAIVNDFLANLGGTKTYGLNAKFFDGSHQHIVNALNYNPNVDSVHVSGYPQGKNLSDAQIQTVVKNAINGGKLGSADVNGVYFVLTDSTVTSSALGGFCITQCGYHFNSHTIISGKDIKYSFVGNAGTRCPTGCSAPAVLGDHTSPNGDIGVDGAISVLWHELSEAITDPDPNSAWTDPTYGETGDACAWKFGKTFTAPNGSHANQHIGSREYIIQMMPNLTNIKVGAETWDIFCAQATK